MSSPRTRSKNNDVKGVHKIYSFFKPETAPCESRIRKRAGPAEEEEETAMPPAKKSPDGLASPALRELSPEQVSRMESKRAEAEARLLTKKMGVATASIGPTWMQALLPEFKKPYIEELFRFVSGERSSGSVYPPAEDVFTWTLACPIDEVKVVIIGQDPYHNPSQAHGLCFSVRVGVSIPPSLLNIYKELKNTIEDFTHPEHGYLAGWAKQGVLLLNACLTVRKKKPNSHAGKGWENLTDAVIHWINSNNSGVVFLLWGSYAQKKGAFINKKKHCILKSVHPSPLSASRGFFGCDHFSKANLFLRKMGKTEIDWNYLPKSIT